MRHLKVLNVLEGKELTTEEISKETKMPLAEVRRLLLRLAEQGKVESFQKEDKIFWRIKQKIPEEGKFKYI